MRWRNRPLEREERLPFLYYRTSFSDLSSSIRITTPLIGDVVVPRYGRKRERHKNEREREKKKKEKEKNSETSENDLPPKSAVGSSNGLAWSAWSFSEVEVAPGVAAVVASAPPPPPPPPPPPDAEFSFSMPVPWNTAHGFVTREIILLSRESASPRTPSLRTLLFIGKKNPTRGGGGDGTGFAPDIYDGVTTAARSMSRNFGTGVSGYPIFPAKPRRRRCGSLILEKNNTSFFLIARLA